MNGWDFSILWRAGHAVLEGRDPFSVAYFYYPLPFAYFLSIFALVPEKVAFWSWILFNLGLLVYFFRLRFWEWVLYVPVMHLLSSGQVDLLFWALARGLKRTWSGALLGAFITLKPQAALVLLPWHLLDWWRSSRETLSQWVAFTIALWGLPTVWRPLWVVDWWQAIPSGGWWATAKNTPGIFSLLQVWPALSPLLVVAAVLISWWGLRQGIQEIGRATAILSLPIGLFYNTMSLLDCAPAALLVPLSWLAAALALLTRTYIPFTLLPMGVLYWHFPPRKTRQPPVV